MRTERAQILRRPSFRDTFEHTELQFFLRRDMSAVHKKSIIFDFDAFAREFEPDWEYVYKQTSRDHFDLYARTSINMLNTRRSSSGPGETKQEVTDESVESFFRRLDELVAVHIVEWRNKARQVNEMLSRVVLEQLEGEIGMNFNLFDERIVSEIAKRSEQFADITTTANIAGVREAVVDGLRQGLDQNKIAAAIRQVHDEGLWRNDVRILDAENRAKLIARTETTAMTNGASQAGMKIAEAESRLGYTKYWVSVGDDRVRPAHLDEEGPWPDGIPLDEVFPVTGLEYPQEPNCRCTLMYSNEPADLSDF